ncbi:MAG: NADH-quinone oxidoreductase subunit C, partial [Aquificaceae bacterium]|nr:NADH-quinone oxidoreductase subunit C [Aquificaceae bacterium]
MNQVTADRVKREFKEVEVERTKHTTNLHVRQEKLVDLMLHLKEKEGYKLFVDHTCIDFPEKKERFQGIYLLYNPDANERVLLKTWAVGGEPPSLEKVLPCARWAEREA